MLLWERVAPSYVGKGGFASIMRLTGLVGIVGGFGLFYSRSIRKSCALRGNIWKLDDNLHRTVLRLHREQARERDGHGGIGGLGAEEGAFIRRVKSLATSTGRGRTKFQICRGIHPCHSMGELCQP